MSKSPQSIKHYICWYFVIILSSAILNWVTFKQNTTSFLISEQLNRHMIRYDLLSDDLNLSEFHANAKDLMPVSVDGFVGIISPKLMRLSDVNDSLLVYERKLELLHFQSDSLVRKVEDERVLNTSAFHQSVMQPYKQRLDSLNQVMAGVDSTELFARGLLIEKANLELEYAFKNKSVIDYITDHTRSFIPEQDLNSLDEHSSNYDSLAVKQSSFKQEQRELIRNIRAETNLFHRSRSASVSFLDFLYYSICVSTTVSFGDIVPNNGWTRFLAIAELLACILLLNWILTGIAKRKDL